MAHFARLDENNVVTMVTVVSNDDIFNDAGAEVEALGVVVCESVVGDGPWVQTSYNGNMRRRYAGIGMTYSSEHDAFINPQPYPSWLLDLEDPDDWTSPVSKPTEEGYWYEWDEGEQTWIAHEIEQPAE
jgi:hypothetical protein